MLNGPLTLLCSHLGHHHSHSYGFCLACLRFLKSHLSSLRSKFDRNPKPLFFRSLSSSLFLKMLLNTVSLTKGTLGLLQLQVIRQDYTLNNSIKGVGQVYVQCFEGQKLAQQKVEVKKSSEKMPLQVLIIHSPPKFY